MKWHKINWEKIHQILDETVFSSEDDPQTRFWLTMSKNAKMPLDKEGNLPQGFTWELGYKSKLPLVSDDKEYLCYFEDFDCFAVCDYDDEQEFEPLFWDNGEPCYPSHWAELESPVT